MANNPIPPWRPATREKINPSLLTAARPTLPRLPDPPIYIHPDRVKVL
ncbi:hypothetical protein SPB21_03655 [Leptothoe sp. ISB3NOV94-8A]